MKAKEKAQKLGRRVHRGRAMQFKAERSAMQVNAVQSGTQCDATQFKAEHSAMQVNAVQSGTQCDAG
jgi:hypothetical protein